VNTITLFALTGTTLFALGLHALLVHPHLLRKILAVNVMSSGVFLLLTALAKRAGTPPDAVPHAMVITGIVVAVASTALALVLMLKVVNATGRPVLPDEPTQRE